MLFLLKYAIKAGVIELDILGQVIHKRGGLRDARDIIDGNLTCLMPFVSLMRHGQELIVQPFKPVGQVGRLFGLPDSAAVRLAVCMQN